MADKQTTVALNIGSQRISMAVFEVDKSGGLVLKAYDSETIVADPAMDTARIAHDEVPCLVGGDAVHRTVRALREEEVDHRQRGSRSTVAFRHHALGRAEDLAVEAALGMRREVELGHQRAGAIHGHSVVRPSAAGARTPPAMPASSTSVSTYGSMRKSW